ncbi:MAG: hypothetical protein MZV65_33755 [Chromatiales bacterium]|nr:hypothetical protein [Chromatiales bacterium]
MLVAPALFDTLVSAAGETAGIAVGRVPPRLLSNLAGRSTAVSPAAVLLASGFSSGIGMLFGLCPARKAAGLNPIDALRHESRPARRAADAPGQWRDYVVNSSSLGVAATVPAFSPPPRPSSRCFHFGRLVAGGDAD